MIAVYTRFPAPSLSASNTSWKSDDSLSVCAVSFTHVAIDGHELLSIGIVPTLNVL